MGSRGAGVEVAVPLSSDYSAEEVVRLAAERVGQVADDVGARLRHAVLERADMGGRDPGGLRQLLARQHAALAHLEQHLPREQQRPGAYVFL